MTTPLPVPILDHDDTGEVYGAGEDIETRSEFEYDDLGNEFEACPDGDSGRRLPGGRRDYLKKTIARGVVILSGSGNN
jgi:hypothetical protein